MRGSNGALIAGVAAGAVILGIIAWLLGIGPRLDRAAVANDERAAQVSFNDTLELTLLARMSDAKLIPEYRERIFDIRDDLPPVLDIPAIRRKLEELHVENGLVVSSEAIGETTVMTPGISLALQAAEVGRASQLDGLAFTGLLATPIDLRVAGSREQVFGLLNDLQTGDHQYFLLIGLTIDPVLESEIVTDVLLSPGDLYLNITGFVFTLDYGNPDIQLRPEPEPSPSPDPTPEPSPDPSAPPEPEPEPNDRNFFIPIGGN